MSLKDEGNKRPPQTKGRRRIPIAYITDQDKRSVTFSKRRVGLFKKAAELCALSGSHIAILAFTEAGKAFSFGHPNVDAVLQRCHHHYLSGHDAEAATEISSVVPITSSDDDHFARNVRMYNQHYRQVMKQIEDERKKSIDDHRFIRPVSLDVKTDEAREEVNDASGFWWEKSVDGLGLDELEQYVLRLEQLKNNVAFKAADRLAMSTKA